MKWKKFRQNIPSRIQVKGKVFYEVLFSKNLGDARGITDPVKKQIILELDQSDKLMVMTFFHEYLHALSEEHSLELTEAQVANLEHTFKYLNSFLEMCNK